MAERIVYQSGSNQQDEIDRLHAAGSMIGPLWTRARWTVGLLIVGIVADAAGILTGAYQRTLLSDAVEGRTISFSEAETADALYGLTGLIQFGIFVATVIAFLMWFQMAYSSLPSLGALDLPYKRGWASGAWFIPFFNLVGPKQIANAIYRASDPSLPRRPGVDWKALSVSPLLHLWWAVWIIGLVLGRIPLAATVETTEQSLQQTTLFMWVDLSALVSGALALAVVRLLTKRLVARATLLNQPGATEPN